MCCVWGGGEGNRVEIGGERRIDMATAVLKLEVSTTSLPLVLAANGIKPPANPIRLRAWHYSLL